jgi:H+/Cl- antiporter ClcA
MRYVFFLGGLAGFSLAALSGWSAGRAADRIFLDASLGCLVGGLLFRWLWNVMLRGLRETLIARRPAPAAPAREKP